MIKVNIKRQQGIIHVPDDFAILDKVTKDGYYHYVVRYSADVQRAVQNDSVTVKIRVSNKPYAQQVQSPLATFNGSQIVSGLLLNSAKNRDASKAFEANYVLSITSDISAKISNSKTRQLTGFAKKLKLGNRGSVLSDTFGSQRPTPYSSQKTLALMSVSELNPQNIAHPIHQTHLFRDNPFAQPTTNYQAKELAEELAYKRAIDPSAVAKNTKFIASTKSQLGGATPPVKFNIATQLFDRTTYKQDLLRSSLIGTQKDQLPSQFTLPDSAKVNVSVTKTTNFVNVEEDLLIPVGAINDTFYLIFQLYDSSGVEVETEVGIVSHARNLATFTIPLIPPRVSTTQGGSKIGSNVLEIQQVDENAVGVYVYKRILTRGTPQVNAEYTLVKKLALTPQDGTKRLVDVTNNYDPTIYRVIPYNQFELKGSEFGSVVIQSRKIAVYARIPGTRRKNFVTLAHTILDNGVRLEVGDVPAGPVALQLCRRNLSITEKNRNVVGDTFLLNTNGNNTTVFFKDLFVEDGRIYEYSVKLIYKDGSYEFSPTNLVVEFNPTQSNIISTQVTPPVVVRNGVDLDVQFDISSTVVDGKMDLVKKTMETQGILGYFRDDITSNRQNLQDLIAYEITRTDVTAGLVEYFGVIGDLHFSDRKFGPNKAVTPLQEDHEYRYTINTHFRTAESLIDTFTRTVQNSTDPNISYTLTPSKWYHPVTLTEGNIVSVNSLQRNHSKTDFTFGDLAGTQTVAASFVQGNPTLSNGQAQKLGVNKVLIQWKVQGDIKKIDHFVVILEILGMRTIIGQAHNISDSNLIQFIDKIKEDEHAEHTYYVVPVYYNWVRGTELKTNTVIV